MKCYGNIAARTQAGVDSGRMKHMTINQETGIDIQYNIAVDSTS